MDQKIVRAKIHPGIGIARVGNSQDAYFIGPEVVDPIPREPGFYKDEQGALKRQAARFRIYGYNAAGEPVCELTHKNADIQWQVHVANTKAAWYDFATNMRLPGATSTRRRNSRYEGEERQKLVIDGGFKDISGPNKSGKTYEFSGHFLHEEVYLGELRTDEEGRLVFLGGRGVSNTPFPNNNVFTYANNDGWHDDTSDGPVEAAVMVDGQQIPCDAGWVIVGPPNYAPDIIGVKTMYDTLYDLFAFASMVTPPKVPSFKEHIQPIFSQFNQAQWVNKGFSTQFGWKAPYDFSDPKLLAMLSRTDDVHQELRRQIFNFFRSPFFERPEPNAWPWMYGDLMTTSPDAPPRAWLAMTKHQYGWLQQWVRGNFIDDYDPNPKAITCIGEFPLKEQPAMLDKAALYYCLGGAFHPGCEMTWPMTYSTVYTEAFRIRVRGPEEPVTDYGPILTPEVVNSTSGPVFAQGPGDITRWMAVPWQTDTASCRAGYTPNYDPYLPTFWPARVPNHVLTEEDYAAAMDTKLSKEERETAFQSRAVWYRGLGTRYIEQINDMVTDFGKLGVVERREGDGTIVPKDVYVETKPEFHEIPHKLNNLHADPRLRGHRKDEDL